MNHADWLQFDQSKENNFSEKIASTVHGKIMYFHGSIISIVIMVWYPQIQILYKQER